jgi:hypothetical protein
MSSTFAPPAPLQTAVLFLVFNRPDTTAQVFEAIRKAKPPRLYVAADGPRANRDGEAERVARVREIATAVDWPCEVKTLFREENLGCKYAVSGGITWFFEHEEQGIILEDDILVDLRFFYFIEGGLAEYKNDYKVGGVAGYNLLGSYANKNFFARYPHIWGWGTWRRVWIEYSVDIQHLPAEINRTIYSHLESHKVANCLVRMSEKIRDGSLNTWDFQYGYLHCMNRYLTLFPGGNLVTNIGFSEQATHTTSGASAVVSSFNSIMNFPASVSVDPLFDKQRFALEFPVFWKKTAHKLTKLLRG